MSQQMGVSVSSLQQIRNIEAQRSFQSSEETPYVMSVAEFEKDLSISTEIERGETFKMNLFGDPKFPVFIKVV